MKKLITKSNGKKSYFVLLLFIVLKLFDDKLEINEVDTIEKALTGGGLSTIFHKLFRFLKPIIKAHYNMKNSELGIWNLKEEKRIAKRVNGLIKPMIVRYANTQKFWLKILLKLFKNKGSIIVLKAVQYLDNNFADKLTPQFKEDLRELTSNIADNDIEKFKVSVAKVANSHIDLPKINEKGETKVFKWLVDGIEIFGNILLKKR